MTAYVDAPLAALIGAAAAVMGQTVSRTISDTLLASESLWVALSDLGERLEAAPERRRKAVVKVVAFLAATEAPT